MSSITGGGSVNNSYNRTIDPNLETQESQHADDVRETRDVPNFSGDTYGLTDGDAAPADSPELDGTMPPPDLDGPFADPDKLSGQLAFAGDTSIAALEWAALSEMARIAQQEIQNGRALKNAMHDGKINSRKDSIKAEEEINKAQRDESRDQLIAAGVALAVTTALAVGGAAATNSANTNKAQADSGGATAAQQNRANVGNVMTNVANQAGRFTETAINHTSKTTGAGREVADAKERQKRYEMIEAEFDASIDSANETIKGAQESFQLALRILNESQERKTQIDQKIFGS